MVFITFIPSSANSRAQEWYGRDANGVVFVGDDVPIEVTDLLFILENDGNTSLNEPKKAGGVKKLFNRIADFFSNIFKAITRFFKRIINLFK